MSDHVELRRLRKERIFVEIESEGPGLLQCRLGKEDMEILQSYEPGNVKKKPRPRDVEDIWRGRLHAIDQTAERYGHPATGIKESVVRASKALGLVMTDVRQWFRIPCGLVEIEGSLPELDERWGRPNGKGAPMMVYRPCFPEWRMRVPVVYNAELVSAAQILALFEQAGFSVGIGSFRPETGGEFGCFHVKGEEE